MKNGHARSKTASCGNWSSNFNTTVPTTTNAIVGPHIHSPIRHHGGQGFRFTGGGQSYCRPHSGHVTGATRAESDVRS